jgi:hypothetical protein
MMGFFRASEPPIEVDAGAPMPHGEAAAASFSSLVRRS